jgi:hypothetical protein
MSGAKGIAMRFLFVLFLMVLAMGFTQADHSSSAEKLGTVHFSTSCSAATEPQFNRAVALMHSFQFPARSRHFMQSSRAMRRVQWLTGGSL